MSDPRQLFENAVQCLGRGEFARAEGIARAMVASFPGHVDAMQLLGVILAQSGRCDEAAGLLETCLAHRPQDPAVLTNLGEVRRMQGRYEDAVSLHRRAISLAPRFAEAHYNLGVALKHAGDDEAAVEAYRRTLSLRPDHGKARFNLANALKEQGRVPLALAEYEQALAGRPHWFEARLNFGNALLEMGQTDRAIAQYEAALALQTGDVDVADNLAAAHVKQGSVDKATAIYRKTLDRPGDQWVRELRIQSLAEVVPPSNAYIDEFRQALLHYIRDLGQQRLSLDLSALHGSAVEPPMLLAYHGRDERPVREAYGELFSKLIPPLEPYRPEGMPHIGVVVTHGHEGVFYHCLGSLIERLDRSKLRVTIVCSLAGKNILSHLFFRTPQEYLVLPTKVDEAARTIRDARFCVLHYWEVGTDSTNYFLPFFRPAPVQSTTWGWPVTTGISTVDYFVSAQGMEPADGPSHYRERLVTLEAAPTFYLRPPIPADRKSRQELGLPTSGRLYFCPQNVRKYHPDFDAVLAGILRSDGDGRLVVIGDEQAKITAKLMARWNRAMPDVASRIQVLPRMPREVYWNVLALADVNLDTLHYGGGANTVYDTVATGTPIVTLPGSYHRGRFTLATLSALQLTETIAATPEDYVRRAVEIACDPDRQAAIRRAFAERGAAVLEDVRAVRAYQDFLLMAAELAASKETPRSFN